jgi:enediyne biosynthesis protein E4
VRGVLPIVLLSLTAACVAEQEAPEPVLQTDLPDGDAAELVLGDEVVCADPVNGRLPFEDVTEAAGIGFAASTYAWPAEDDSYNTMDVEMTGGFVARDLDGDGLLDLVFADGDEDPRVFLGAGGFDFEAVPAGELGIPTDGRFRPSVSAADLDADGDADLLLLGREENVYLENLGGSFVDRTEERGLAGGEERSLSSSWVDFDRDGDLDVFVANFGPGAWDHYEVYPPHRSRLLRQQDDGTFVDAIDDLLPVERDGHTMLGAWFDADQDGWLDLYVANDLANDSNHKPPNALVRNLGSGDDEHWDFELADESGVDAAMLSMGVAVGDMEGDGDLDLHVTNAGQTLLARNEGDWLFTDVSLATEALSVRLIGDVSWSTWFFDHDADGRQELFTAFGHLISRFDAEMGGPQGSYNQLEQQDALWWWDPEQERYEDIAAWVGINDPAMNRTSLPVDIDGDGFLDLVTWALYDGPRLWRSACNDNAWLTVRLSMPGTRNIDAVGARVEAWTRDGQRIVRQLQVGGTGNFSTGPPEVHLGLGSWDVVALVVHWPDGVVTVNVDVPTRREVLLIR